MIPLTLSAVADITGARLGPLTGPAALVRSVVIDSRQAGPAPCSPPCPASGRTGTTSRSPRSRRARWPCSPAGRWACPH